MKGNINSALLEEIVFKLDTRWHHMARWIDNNIVDIGPHDKMFSKINILFTK